MSKNSGLLVLCLLLAVSATAQVGNEWINFSQPYYKIPTVQDGIYRLTYSDLQQAGFPVDAVNPKNLQIFHRGVEQAIFVNGEGDGTFNNSDFIEFYGKKITLCPGAYLLQSLLRYHTLFPDHRCCYRETHE
jgi:hypothetical protein